MSGPLNNPGRGSPHRHYNKRKAKPAKPYKAERPAPFTASGKALTLAMSRGRALHAPLILFERAVLWLAYVRAVVRRVIARIAEPVAERIVGDSDWCAFPPIFRPHSSVGYKALSSMGAMSA